jgi:protein-disulfide isomerase-like protein with CxxC motif
VEASRPYWSVVSEQHAAEDYPVTALRRLAFMYFSAGDDYAAASVLTELAAEFGDPATRLRSLFDAALLYRDAARSDRVLECVRQIRPLLKSVAIPQATRAEIASRIALR